MARLANKVVLITGAAGGLGEAFARAAAREGARLVLTDLDLAGVERYASELDADTLTLAHDVTERARWEQVIAGTEERFGALHGLVHNAGLGTPAAFDSMSDEFWQRLFAVNVDSVFVGSQVALPLLERSGGGSIVNISSVAAMVSGPMMTAYCASKGAVRALTKSMAVEFALTSTPVRVNSVHPAYTRTKMVTDILELNPDPAKAERKLARAIAMKRLGEPSEIAGIVVHLLSDESSFTTGAEHIIDGGLTSM